MLHLDARVKVGIHAQEDLPAAQLLPDDVETLKAMLLAERQAHRAEVRDQALLIEKLEHQIAELRHDRFGQYSSVDLLMGIQSSSMAGTERQC
jgi:hypothetical protein